MINAKKYRKTIKQERLEISSEISRYQRKISCKDGHNKDTNGMDLTEAEAIKKRWQEYTELYKKDLHDPDKHHGVITHLESDILECKVKWALRGITMNKTNGGDGIPVELFQILKDDAVKVLHNNRLVPNWERSTSRLYIVTLLI